MPYTKKGPFTNVPEGTTPPSGAVPLSAATFDHIEQGIVDASTPEAWITPTLLNAWAHYGTPFSGARYYKDPLGIVRLKGLVQSGTVAGDSTGNIFTLPAGYRPTEQRVIVTISNGAIARLDVLTDGSVRAVSGSNVWFSLDGVSFRAEA